MPKDSTPLAFSVSLCTGDVLWRYQVDQDAQQYAIAPPTFHVNGSALTAAVSKWSSPSKTRLSNGVYEVQATGTLQEMPSLQLHITLWAAEDNPMVRFTYRLQGTGGKLTKPDGHDQLTYMTVQLSKTRSAKEVRLAEYLEPIHSFSLSEIALTEREFAAGLSIMGPIITASGDGVAAVMAYEHGSQVPDAFMQYRLEADGNVGLEAVKGNYLSSTNLEQQPLNTPWFQFGAVRGCEEDLARAYRTFVLQYMSKSMESRKPYIYYNTWNSQERDYNWRSLAYLANMRQEYILADIDVAHRMGIDVYVLDVGWFERTGDWRVSPTRFPNQLSDIRLKLDGYGMKLGLWFGPKSASLSSNMLHAHEDCVMTWAGKRADPEQIWETEESHQLCLVSRYADAFADKLIELAKTLGVRYFKWDAVGQYGCSDAGHQHGDASHSEEERADSYAFQVGLSMIRIVQKLTDACPEAIVDFDITEGSRFVGLGFLAAGKYFLINNGPYFLNYDLPNPPKYRAENERERNFNLTFYPGPARTWMCRTPLSFDKWIPSILFLTHYYPDDDTKSSEDNSDNSTTPQYVGETALSAAEKTEQWGDYQRINIGSLILGHNGIWGDLRNISDRGIKLVHTYLQLYKSVREDITTASMVRQGNVGGNPEVYEKISPNGRGVVVVFASSFGKPFSTKLIGRYTYITKGRTDARIWHDEGVRVKLDDTRHAIIETEFHDASARIVFFGAANTQN